jgi:hypothetical protein
MLTNFKQKKSIGMHTKVISGAGIVSPTSQEIAMQKTTHEELDRTTEGFSSLKISNLEPPTAGSVDPKTQVATSLIYPEFQRTSNTAESGNSESSEIDEDGTFTLFPKLSLELRRIIWKFALPGQSHFAHKMRVLGMSQELGSLLPEKFKKAHTNSLN